MVREMRSSCTKDLFHVRHFCDHTVSQQFSFQVSHRLSLVGRLLDLGPQGVLGPVSARVRVISPRE